MFIFGLIIICYFDIYFNESSGQAIPGYLNNSASYLILLPSVYTYV